MGTEEGNFNSKLSGKFMYNADVKKDYPAVGDWIAIKSINETEAIIYEILPRKSYFARKLAISGGRKMTNGIVIGGNIEEQIIGANIDIAFIVSGLDDNFNISRIERYITLTLNSGATPVILLNKCDLCHNITDYIEKINAISSSNGKGTHTTTSSQLLQHNSDCTVIDTPGVRELQLWGDEDILSESFQDIYTLVDQCKYRDCTHHKEIGWAVKKDLAQMILENWEYDYFYD